MGGASAILRESATSLSRGAVTACNDSRMSKVVVITGASRGIGAATACAAAAAGYRVVVNYARRRAEAEQVAQSIAEAGGEAVALAGDVANEADVIGLFEEVDRRFGRLDALVNNAGVVGRSGRFADLAAADLKRIFEINVLGSFLCAREAVKRMATSRGGRGGAIVNLSSAAATLGSPGEFVHYAASKGAIDTMTVGLAKEVARENIRVNAVAPGLIDTEMQVASGDPARIGRILPNVPMARMGDAAEIAGPILFLLSDAAAYITGTILRVAGGR
jgi:NAD(P)-dependent dehydrogenase (short-subunit alcohol dehydrogenase family)